MWHNLDNNGGLQHRGMGLIDNKQIAISNKHQPYPLISPVMLNQSCLVWLQFSLYIVTLKTNNKTHIVLYAVLMSGPLHDPRRKRLLCEPVRLGGHHGCQPLHHPLLQTAGNQGLCQEYGHQHCPGQVQHTLTRTHSVDLRGSREKRTHWLIYGLY